MTEPRVVDIEGIVRGALARDGLDHLIPKVSIYMENQIKVLDALPTGVILEPSLLTVAGQLTLEDVEIIYEYEHDALIETGLTDE